MTNVYNTLISPVITEKATKISENNQYVFKVSLNSNKKAIKEAIERKLRQEQEALEYEFRIDKARQEAERQRIDAEGKAKANRILSASLTEKILKEKGIEATIKLSESPNSKVIVIGSGKDGMPIILGNN